MARMTAEQHEEAKALAAELIESGRIVTWSQLARLFGITRQAAQQRFGDKYGLRMPGEEEETQNRVPVTYHEDAPILDIIDRIVRQRGGSRSDVIRTLTAYGLAHAELIQR